jgi:hypothetical protein
MGELRMVARWMSAGTTGCETLRHVVPASSVENHHDACFVSFLASIYSIHLLYTEASSPSNPSFIPEYSGARLCPVANTMSGLHLSSQSLRFKNLLVVIKQTAFEEYSQVRGR